MAHAGKFYKLQFRRDLSMNMAHKIGWAEAYNVVQTGLAGAFGTFIQNREYLCINKRMNNQPPMVWTSAPYDDGGRETFMELFVNDPTPALTNDVMFTCQIFRTLDLEPLVDAVFSNSDPEQNWTRFSGSVGGDIVNTVPGYTVPHFWTVAASAAGWNLYP